MRASTARSPSKYCLSADADRLHRFEQETRAVAALNHPNILAIYDVGQYNGVPFLVSELLEGETLRAVLIAPVCRNAMRLIPESISRTD